MLNSRTNKSIYLNKFLIKFNNNEKVNKLALKRIYKIGIYFKRTLFKYIQIEI